MLITLYRPPVFKGQRGLLGRVLGGGSFAPLFTAQSGVPLPVLISGGTGNACQSFGEMDCTSVGTANHENAVTLHWRRRSPLQYGFDGRGLVRQRVQRRLGY